jgi:hypothetical protein
MRTRLGGLSCVAVAAALVGAVTLSGGAALAQPKAGAKAPAAAKPLTDKQKKDLAKKNFQEAEKKFQSGDFQGSLDAYRRADEVIPGARPKFGVALSLDKLNKTQEAVASYQAFLDSNPDPDKLKQQITDAKARLDALKKTPGKVRVVVNPPAVQDKINVQIDGAPPLMASEKHTFNVQPGRRKIVVTAEGYDAATQEIDLPFAETREVQVTLTKSAPAVAAVPPPASTPPPPAAPPPAPRSNIPAYVTLGLAGAGAIVGTIFGVTALKAKSDFNENPTTDNADKTDRNALIADMSFAVALTFGVTGAVLLLSKDSAPEQKSASATEQQKKKAAKPRGFITPYAGPTGGGAAATLTF